MKAKERLAGQFAELHALELALSTALTRWEAVEEAERSLRDALEPLVERGYSRSKIADLLGVETININRILSIRLADDPTLEGGEDLSGMGEQSIDETRVGS